MRHDTITKAAIDAFFQVYNELGYGFLESVYASALEIVLRERGVPVRREQLIDVIFHGERVGKLRADLVVADLVVLELKTGASMPLGSRAQLISYLRASGLEVGLVLFFGPVPDVQRIAVGRRERRDTSYVGSAVP